MADAAALYDATLACLQEMTAGADKPSVFEGDVPDQPPSDEHGRALPYFVLWASAGAPAPERAVSQRAAPGQVWSVQVTVAAGLQYWVLDSAPLARAALAGAALPDGVLLVEDDGGATYPLLDRDVSPPRFFLPLRFHALTP